MKTKMTAVAMVAVMIVAAFAVVGMADNGVADNTSNGQKNIILTSTDAPYKRVDTCANSRVQGPRAGILG